MHVPTRMGRLENNRIDGPKVCTKMCHYISIQWFTTANTGKICILRKTREHLWMTLRFCDSVCGDNGKSSCRVNGELIRRWHLRILVLKYPGQLRAGIFSHNIGHFRQTNSYIKKKLNVWLHNDYNVAEWLFIFNHCETFKKDKMIVFWTSRNRYYGSLPTVCGEILHKYLKTKVE